MARRTRKSSTNTYPNIKDAEALIELLENYDKSQGIIADTFDITPEVSEVLLSTRNTRNRPISKAQVKDLKQKMEDGSYRVNGESMIFDSDGILTNGQHTLTASVESGKSFQKVVVLGLHPDTFSSLDGGKTRKLEDVLAVNGEDHARELSVALRLVHILTNSKKVRNMGKWHHDRALTELKTHPNLKDSVTFILEMETPASYLLSPGYAAGLHYLMTEACKTDEERITVEQFWKDLIEDENVASDSYAKKLQKRLIAHKQRLDGQTLTRDQLVEIVIKAWCNYRDGKKTTKKLSLPKSEEGTWFIGGLHVDSTEE